MASPLIWSGLYAKCLPTGGIVDYLGNVMLSGSFPNIFTTIQCDAGTSPVADASLDTLTLTSADASVLTTGNSATDTVDYSVRPLMTSTRASPTSVTNATTIAVTAIFRQFKRVTGNGGAVTATLAAGTRDGQIITLMGCDNTNTVTLTGAGQNGDCILALRSVISLFWDNGATEWVEIGRNHV